MVSGCDIDNSEEYNTGSETETTVDINEATEFIEYEIDINFDDKIDKVIEELTLKYKVEKVEENYAVERHYFVLNGTGYNDEYGSIEVDMNFEYPKVIGYKDNKLEEKINRKIFKSFFYKETLQEFAEDDPFNGYNKYEYGNFEVKYSDKNYLSIHTTTSYSEGTSEARSYGSITMNMENGSFLQLRDFVTTDYIIEAIESDDYELDGRIVGVGGNNSIDQIVKDELIGYIKDTYAFDSYTEDTSNYTFIFVDNGYYIDGEHIFIYISSLESYGSNMFLRVPFRPNE